MLIKILDMDTEKGLFFVGAVNTGETARVTGYQLVYSLTDVNECINAKLHNTGIFIIMENGELVRYNVKPIDAKLKKAIRKRLEAEQAQNKVKTPVPCVPQTKPVEHKVTKSEVPVTNTKQRAKASTGTIVKLGADTRVKTDAFDDSKTIKRKISSNPPGQCEEKIRIYYMGVIYNSPRDICRKYGCEDVNTFVKLYKLGYPMLMCLGKEHFDSKLKPTPRDKQYNAYLKSSGHMDM